MSTSITVDATLAGDAQKIATNLAEAQRHLANHTLNYIDTQNTLGTMVVKTPFDLIQECAAAAKTYTTGDSVGSSATKYFDGRRKSKTKKAAMTLQCKVIKGSPRGGRRK